VQNQIRSPAEGIFNWSDKFRKTQLAWTGFLIDGCWSSERENPPFGEKFFSGLLSTIKHWGHGHWS